MAKVKIISDSRILGGKPVIAGTRISVELIMNFLGAGMSTKEIISEYPELKKNEVVAAIEYATGLVRTKIDRSATSKTSVVTLHEISR